MSIINNLKAMLGFPDKEDMGNENSSQTNAIPIVAEEPEEPEIENHKEPEKSHANPNIPEQMELFS